MSFFWKSIENYQQQLVTWSPEQGLAGGIAATCQSICQALRSADAFSAVSDPASHENIIICRRRCVDSWSNLNSLIEHETAGMALAATGDYAGFLELGSTHWLLKGSREMVDAEHELLARHGISLRGLRTCMIGPGAIPYTGLALAAAGAAVDLVDMYGPACDFSRRWMEKFFPATPFALHQCAGQNMDYSGYDLVIVASMLLDRADVMRRIRACNPRYVIVRSTENTRPLCLLLNQVSEGELALLAPATLLGRTAPPPWVGNISMLYELTA